MKIKHATITDKIYIKKEDIEDTVQFERLFTYVDDKELYYTYQYNTDTNTYSVPSNSHHKLEIETYEDLRNFSDTDLDLKFKGTLRPEQQQMADRFFTSGRIRSGVFQAPCGWGKTYVGANLIARSKKKTLVLVHTKLLFYQWIDELTEQIPNIPIGKVGDGLLDIQDVTVGIYKSVLNNLDALHDEFSLVLVDEVHLCPADMFSQAVNSINCRAKIGISATPRRKDGKHIVLPDYFTKFKTIAKDEEAQKDINVEIFQTGIAFNVIDPKRDWSKQINKLASRAELLQMVSDIAKEKIKEGRCILILGDRIDWLKQLSEMIPDSIPLIGETKNEQRQEILDNVGPKYKAVLTTKIFDEGISCHRLDTIFFTFPSNNPIKWEQRVGRIIREHPDKLVPLICDFWLQGAMVSRQQQNRKAWYIKRGYTI
jgi:superfamily II DNA or RNA helicase